ncbi:MAG: hypothetical protein IPP83_12625 [Flavobacteriales bacterium]|nr:hypothetical protein [Flavobacteriales bacterium]
MNFKYFMGDNEARYGVEVLGFRTDFSFFNSLGREYQQQQNTSEIAGYFNYKLSFGHAPATARYLQAVDHRWACACTTTPRCRWRTSSPASA